MNQAIRSMLDRYRPVTAKDYENALKEIIQEVALLGLWRSKFFEHAAFYGGTALRILYGLDRFSEDLDFSLLKSDSCFDLAPHLISVQTELNGMGLNSQVLKKEKTMSTSIQSAFIKTGTKEHLIKINVSESIEKRIQKSSLLQVKLEIDVDPPSEFQIETKTLLLPIPFSVNTYKIPDLFAGKLHAIFTTKLEGKGERQGLL